MQPPKRLELLPDVTLEQYDKRLVVKSGIPLSTVSSAIYNGGRQEDIRCILNLTVHKGYCSSDPVEDLRREASHLGLPERTIGLMTAVDVKNAVVAIEPLDSGDGAEPLNTGALHSFESAASQEQAAGTSDSADTRYPLRVVAVVTAGVSNAWRAGVWPSYFRQTVPATGDPNQPGTINSATDPFVPGTINTATDPYLPGTINTATDPYLPGTINTTTDPYLPGTINTILLVEGKLSDAALVNAVITVTEAKTAIFYERGIRCPASGRMATGTTTDAIVIATTGRGEEMPYAGPGTAVGAMLARAFSRALNEALDIWERDR